MISAWDQWMETPTYFSPHISWGCHSVSAWREICSSAIWNIVTKTRSGRIFRAFPFTNRKQRSLVSDYNGADLLMYFGKTKLLSYLWIPADTFMTHGNVCWVLELCWAHTCLFHGCGTGERLTHCSYSVNVLMNFFQFICSAFYYIMLYGIKILPPYSAHIIFPLNVQVINKYSFM